MIRDIPLQVLEKFGDNAIGQSGDELIYKCPFCQERRGTPDTKGHLYVNKKNLMYFCQRCEARGYLGDLETKGYDFTPTPTNVELMNSIGGIISRGNRGQEYYSLKDSYPITENLKFSIYEMQAINYLYNRGFNLRTIKFYGIRLGDIFSRYRYRIIVPNEIKIIDDTEYTDMFVARWFSAETEDYNGKKISKYLNPRGENRRSSVFNLHRIKDGDPIIITEGCFTSMSAGRNSVATYGKYITSIQLTKILAKNPSLIYVALDPDALDAARKICHRIYQSTDIPLKLVILPDGEDANSLGHEKFMSYLRRSIDYDPVRFGIYDLVNPKSRDNSVR